MQGLKTPVLLIIYRRIETTRKVLEKIREVKPSRLYISGNAPNPLNPADKLKTDETRDIVNEIDWDCEIITNFRTEHLSARYSITSGISWFFSKEEEGIILEDDCVVDASFFWMCEQLLAHYRNDKRVMHIGASNFQDGIIRGDGSYYFSRYNHIWGWAAWRRSWEIYNVDFCSGNGNEFVDLLDRVFSRKLEQKFWKHIYKYIRTGFIDTWDTQYMFSFWQHGGVAITPNSNLVSNIGFGKEATNTHSPLSKWANLKVESLLVIKHPSKISIHEDADLYTADNFYGVTKAAKFFFLKLRLARLITPYWKNLFKSLLQNF